VQVRVLLTKDVPNFGKAGDMKRVARGYANNYLFPRGLAMMPTAGAVRHVEIMAKADAKRNEKANAEARALAERIDKTTLSFKAKVGEQGRLYGSITSQDIVDKLNEKLGLDVDRRKITLPEPLKQVGDFKIAVQLFGEVSGTVTVKVVAEEE
jgi:large subunit ribosomal protein L9